MLGMSGYVVITVEYKDPAKPSKSTAPMDVEDAISGMRDLAFRVAVGEYKAVYMTNARPLGRYEKTASTPSQ